MDMELAEYLEDERQRHLYVCDNPKDLELLRAGNLRAVCRGCYEILSEDDLVRQQDTELIVLRVQRQHSDVAEVVV